MTTKSDEARLEELDLHMTAILTTLRRPDLTADLEEEGCTLLAKAIVIKAFITSKKELHGKNNN